MTIQEMMAAKLAELEIPSKKIQVYGSQIVITCWSLEAANRFAQALSHFAKVRRVIESLDEKADSDCFTPPSEKYVKVWRVGAVIGAVA
jgi:hypothetical protein